MHNNAQNSDRDFSEGRLMTGITMLGYALLAGILFLVFSIPIVTMGSSLSAFYYSMAKSVRYERSYPGKEFLRGFKRVLVKGIFYFVCIALAFSILFFSRSYYSKLSDVSTVWGMAVCDVVIAFLAAFTVWIFPVLSRFDIGIKKTISLTITISLKKFYYTIILAALMICSVYLVWRLSVGFILIVPAAACYASTFIIERAFRDYLPKPDEHEDGWWYS